MNLIEEIQTSSEDGEERFEQLRKSFEAKEKNLIQFGRKIDDSTDEDGDLIIQNGFFIFIM